MEKKSKEEDIENKGKNRVENKNKNKDKNNKKNNKKKKKHIGLRIFLIILLILIICGAVFAVKVVQNGGGMQGVLKTSLGHDNDTVNKLEKLYCLIFLFDKNLK